MCFIGLLGARNAWNREITVTQNWISGNSGRSEMSVLSAYFATFKKNKMKTSMLHTTWNIFPKCNVHVSATHIFHHIGFNWIFHKYYYKYMKHMHMYMKHAKWLLLSSFSHDKNEDSKWSGSFTIVNFHFRKWNLRSRRVYKYNCYCTQ